MRMDVYTLLSAFILGYSESAGVVLMGVKEMNSVSLPCSNVMDNSMTWTKVAHGRYSFIFSLIGDEEQRGNDPERRLSSMGHNSLDINRVYPSDTGKYFCNNHPSVELTVIPTGASILQAREGTSVTLTCPHVTDSYDAIWKRESDGWIPGTGLTLGLMDVRPYHSGLFSCGGIPVVYLNVTTGDEEAPSTTTDTTTTSTSATRRPTIEGARDHLPPQFGLVYRVTLMSVLIFIILCFFLRLWRIKRGVRRSRKEPTENDMVDFTGDAGENKSFNENISDRFDGENTVDDV